MGYTTDFTGCIKLSKPIPLKLAKKWLEWADDRDVWEKQSGINDYLQWVPTETLDGIVWDGNEKFYSYEESLKFLVDFLKHQDIECDGVLYYSGEDSTDHGKIVVKNGGVTLIPDLIATDSKYQRPLTMDKLTKMILDSI